MPLFAAGERDTFTCAEDVVDRDLGEELLVHKEGTDEIFVLNAHARIVFEEAKQAKTRGEVHGAVEAKGYRSEAVVRAVDGALDQMIKDGILVRVEPTAG